MEGFLERCGQLLTILYPRWVALAMAWALAICLLALILLALLKSHWPKAMLAIGLVVFSLVTAAAALVMSFSFITSGPGMMIVMAMAGAVYAAAKTLRLLRQDEIRRAYFSAGMTFACSLIASFFYLAVLMAMPTR
jgi:hypothetical protein